MIIVGKGFILWAISEKDFTSWPDNPVLFYPVSRNTLYSVNFKESDPLISRKATNEAGQVVWQWESEAFGNALPQSSGIAVNLRFPGQYYDAETGLYYNYFRDYDPTTGRYIQSDPLGLYDGPNTYSYAHGNPIVYSDPTGEFVPQLIGFGIGAGLEYLTNPCATLTDLLVAGAIGTVGGGLSKAAFLRFGPKSLTREHGKVWSHSISRKAVNKYTDGAVNKVLNRRGGYNGSWVNPRRHHLHDQAATIKGGGRKLPLPLRGGRPYSRLAEGSRSLRCSRCRDSWLRL